MTDHRFDALVSAVGDIDTAYLEETLDFKAKKHTKRTVRFPKLSAACAAVLILVAVSATAFAVSRLPLSWRDIFHTNQTVIGDSDEVPIVSQQHADVESLRIDVAKAISDERTLYLLYTVKGNEGAVLTPEGRFAAFELYFPHKMMSGAYQQYFLERKVGVPENELEGVVYADWQSDDTAGGLTMTFSNWQEAQFFEDAAVDCSIAELAASSGGADIPLPYGGLSLCDAVWENGILRLVMKGPKTEEEWSTGQHWYFLDKRTETVICPEQRADYHYPDESDESSDWLYFSNYVSVEEEALPYLEMHWGGEAVFTTTLTGEWRVTLNETPITVESELLAENISLFYSGEELLAEKIECSKLSMAVYFADYVDPTTGILSQFQAFDANGDPFPCDWGFTADQNDARCMIWTRFREPIDPTTVCKVTFNGETIFKR